MGEKDRRISFQNSSKNPISLSHGVFSYVQLFLKMCTGGHGCDPVALPKWLGNWKLSYIFPRFEFMTNCETVPYMATISTFQLVRIVNHRFSLVRPMRYIYRYICCSRLAINFCDLVWGGFSQIVLHLIIKHNKCIFLVAMIPSTLYFTYLFICRRFHSDILLTQFQLKIFIPIVTS